MNFIERWQCSIGVCRVYWDMTLLYWCMGKSRWSLNGVEGLYIALCLLICCQTPWRSFAVEFYHIYHIYQNKCWERCISYLQRCISYLQAHLEQYWILKYPRRCIILSRLIDSQPDRESVKSSKSETDRKGLSSCAKQLNSCQSCRGWGVLKWLIIDVLTWNTKK